MAKIAIIGPGALGGTLAGWLARGGQHEVILCTRTAFERLVVQTPEGVIEADATILTDPAQAGVVDWVLVATKVYDLAGAAPWLERLVGPRTSLAVIQNGVEHRERMVPYVPAEIVVPAVVDIPAQRLAPGHMRQHRLGWIVVPDDAQGRDFVALFADTSIDVSAVSDWTSRAWAKLCLNCAGAFSALTLSATGPVWNDEVAALLRGLVTECAMVAQAEGAVIEEAVIERVIEGARQANEAGANSIYADRLAGRPMEIDARNGVIVRLGRKHGIPTPINALFVTLLSAAGSPWIKS